MASFAYSAINAAGIESSGEISAADVSAAREALRNKGLLPLQLVEEAAGEGASAAAAVKKVKPKALQVFSRQSVSRGEAGEAAGILDIVLDRVAFQIEKETVIKRRVKGAMMYPL